MSMGLMVAAMKLRVGNPLRKLVLINWQTMPATGGSAGRPINTSPISARSVNVPL